MHEKPNHKKENEEIEISLAKLKQAIKEDFETVDRESKQLVKLIQEDINAAIAYGPQKGSEKIQEQQSGTSWNLDSDIPKRSIIGRELIAASVVKFQEKAEIDIQVVQLYDQYEVNEASKSEHILKYLKAIEDRMLEDFSQANEDSENAVAAVKLKLSEPETSLRSQEKKMAETTAMLTGYMNVFNNPMTETPEEREAQKFIKTQITDLAEKAKKDFDAAQIDAAEKTEKTKQNIREYMNSVKDKIHVEKPNHSFPNAHSDINFEEVFSDIKDTQIKKFHETNEDMQKKVSIIKHKVDDNVEEVNKEIHHTVVELSDIRLEKVFFDAETFQEKASSHFDNICNKMQEDVDAIKNKSIENPTMSQFNDIDEKMQEDITKIKNNIAELLKGFERFLPSRKEN